MNTLRLTRAEAAAYSYERRFWRAMRKQPQPNGGKGLAPIKPYHTSIDTWTFVLVATGMGDGTSGISCPHGQPGDRIRLKRERGEPDWHCITPEITAVTVEQRNGRWGWVVEVGA
jgi:hypothetical protein